MLILIDTSIWIDLLGTTPKYRITPKQLETVATCPPIIQELLQGIQNEAVNRVLKERFLALKCLCEPLGIELFIRAAEIYSLGRKRGFTIRSSFDCLIAAIALEHGATVWHRDRDFDLISEYTALKTLTRSFIPES